MCVSITQPDTKHVFAKHLFWIDKGTDDVQLVNKNGNRGSIPIVMGILASLKYVLVWLEKEAQMTDDV